MGKKNKTRAKGVSLEEFSKQQAAKEVKQQQTIMEDILNEQSKQVSVSQMSKKNKPNKQDDSDLPGGGGADADFPSYNQLDAFGLDTTDKKNKTKVITEAPAPKKSIIEEALEEEEKKSEPVKPFAKIESKETQQEKQKKAEQKALEAEGFVIEQSRA